MAQTNIVVLGAGYAGIRTAKRLIQKLDGNITLTLIDKQTYHTLLTNLHEVASGRVRPDALMIPLEQIFKNLKIELVQDEITTIDFAGKKLTGLQGSYRYDYLVLAAGSKPVVTNVPGATEHTLSLDSVESATRIKQQLDLLKQGSVVICGAGLTGVELAGDIKVMYPDLDVVLLQARDTILPELEPKLRSAITERLLKIGIDLVTGTRVIAFEKNKIEALGPNGPVDYPANLILYTGGVRPQQLSEEVEIGNSGRLPSDEFLRLLDHPSVFTAGDNSDGGSNTVVNGHRQAESIAFNIEKEMKDEPLQPFKPKSTSLLISMGPGYGFTDTKIPLRGWPAVVLKFLVDLFYVLTIAGPGSLIRYFNSHLVEISHRKTITGGLLASRGQRLWLFPLRLYVGALWFTEGYKKIIGPANFATARNLADYFKIGQDSWLLDGNLMIPFNWLKQSDAVSGATMVGPKGPLLENLPGWYEALMRTIMPTTTIAMFFQTLLVMAEVAVGIGLMLGLLTWLSALVSVGLTANFILSGLGGWEMIWILPSSIALMAGAGQFLGLDQFLIPRLRRSFGADIKQPGS